MRIYIRIYDHFFGSLSLWLGWGGWGSAAGLFRLGRGGGGYVAFGGRFVFIAAIIGDVKTSTLEEEARPASDSAGHLAFAPRFFSTKLLGTDR